MNTAECISRSVTVDAHATPGEGVFTTLQAAIDAAPADGTEPWTIHLRAGLYHEKIVVDKPHIRLIGEGRERTVLRWGCWSGEPHPDGGIWGTTRCATLWVRAPDFHAEHLGIENSFDHPANDRRTPGDPLHTLNPQAVALMTDAGADRTRLQHLTISGHQDTLFLNAGRSHITDCRILGHVDFIFGAGVAFFDACELVSRPRGRAEILPVGYVTAASTPSARPFGFVFQRCRLLRENGHVPDQSCLLGRPWHPTTDFSDGRYADPDARGSVVFIDCFMDRHIAPEGWAPMTGIARRGHDRICFQPADARLFEHGSSGPGALTHPERRQLPPEHLPACTRERVLEGWTP